MNKGLKLVFCKECNRKRYCSITRLSYYRDSYLCSKGHSWIIKLSGYSLAVANEIDRIAPKLKSLFERDETFFTRMRIL